MTGALSSALRDADADVDADASADVDADTGADADVDTGAEDAAEGADADAGADVDTRPSSAGSLGFVMSAPHSRQNRFICSYDVRQRGHSKRCAGVDDIERRF